MSLLPLDTEYCLVKSNKSSVEVVLDIDPSKNYTHACVVTCSFAKSFYVLPRDAILTIIEGSNVFNITFGEGNLDVSDTITLFQNLIQGITGFTYVMILPLVESGNSNNLPDRSKYQWTVSNNTGVQPSFFTSDSYLANALGLNVNQNNTFVNNILVSPNVINFQSYDEILIKSNLVKCKSRILECVYSNGTPYNSSISFQQADSFLNAKELSLNSGNSYNFQIVDNQGLPIDFNGSYWSMVVAIFRRDNLADVIKGYIGLLLQDRELSKIP